MRVVPRALGLVLGLAATCVVRLHDTLGLECDDTHPCAAGQSCTVGRCALGEPEGNDGGSADGGPLDGGTVDAGTPDGGPECPLGTPSDGGFVPQWACNPKEWCSLQLPGAPDLSGVFFARPDRGWAVGRAGSLFAWDGHAWFPVAASTSEELRSVFAVNACEGWITASQGKLVRILSGSYPLAQSPDPLQRSLNGAFGAGLDFWAVGNGQTILRWNGQSWAVEYQGVPSLDLYGVWGSSESEVWAVGDQGTLLHRRSPGGWSTATSPTQSSLYAVWGTGPSDAWAAGQGGVLLRWNGGSWALFPSPSASTLRALWGSSATDVWAAGSAGALTHWDGATWSQVASPTSGVLQGLGGSSATDVWAVGAGGVLLHRMP